MQAEYDAILSDWMLMAPDGADKGYLIGLIFEDKKGRFPNGIDVYTSSFPIEGVVFKDGEVIQTRNTKYLLQNQLKPFTREKV